MAVTNCITHHYACDCREAAHAEEVKQLRAALQRLVEFFDDPCSFDHDGDCQAHCGDNIGDECRVAQARELLAANAELTGDGLRSSTASGAAPLLDDGDKK